LLVIGTAGWVVGFCVALAFVAAVAVGLLMAFFAAADFSETAGVAALPLALVDFSPSVPSLIGAVFLAAGFPPRPDGGVLLTASI